jgi:hypothetical protein
MQHNFFDAVPKRSSGLRIGMNSDGREAAV